MNNNNHQAGSSTSTHGRSSVPEANDFLQRMKAKNPGEVLGAGATERLGWAFIQATVGCMVLMAALTVVPYWMSKAAAADDKKGLKAPEQPATQDAAKTEPKNETPKTGDKTPPTATTDNKKDKAVPSKDIVHKLKEDETKAGAPKDPFGPNIDDLIDKK